MAGAVRRLGRRGSRKAYGCSLVPSPCRARSEGGASSPTPVAPGERAYMPRPVRRTSRWATASPRAGENRPGPHRSACTSRASCRRSSGSVPASAATNVRFPARRCQNLAVALAGTQGHAGHGRTFLLEQQGGVRTQRLDRQSSAKNTTLNTRSCPVLAMPVSRRCQSGQPTRHPAHACHAARWRSATEAAARSPLRRTGPGGAARSPGRGPGPWPGRRPTAAGPQRRGTRL